MGDADKGGVSLFRKEIPLPCTLPEKIHIAGEQLEELQCLPIALPARGGAAFEAAIRFASAPTTRCCSAHLVEVRSNLRLPRHYSMRRAPAMPLFRKQSAAEVTSLAPHDSKARLISVTTCRRFMAKPCTPHPHCAARAVIQAANPQWRGQGAAPLAFSWGSKGAILSRERMAPLLRAAPSALPLPPAPCAGNSLTRWANQKSTTFFEKPT